ncbi:SseB family protein [Companilactobacillus hulinensis]|uniref:SseB family protein n=1 Tax=Companilactobacillus hulinensis TaxID=2486007 RepID=UPI0013DE2201|nr:SseB family protein [Companilactobacillus hulinensis]
MKLKINYYDALKKYNQEKLQNKSSVIDSNNQLAYMEIKFHVQGFDLTESESNRVDYTYDESLSINRSTRTIRYKEFLGEYTAIHEFQMNSDIGNLLDECQKYISEMKVSTEYDNQDEFMLLFVQKNDGRKEYVEFSNKNPFPKEWKMLINVLNKFFEDKNSIYKIFDTELFTSERKYIYCKVTFQPDGKEYYYRTNDETLKVGDKVIVTVGEGYKRRVTITDIEYYEESKVPYPLAETKKILGRAELTAKIIDENDSVVRELKELVRTDKELSLETEIDDIHDDEHPLRYSKVIEMDDSSKWMVVFSNKELIDRHQTVSLNAKDILEHAMDAKEISGVILNPWENTKLINKEVIKNERLQV